MRIPVFLRTALLLFVHAAQAQTDKALLRELVEENRKAVEALALYPSETRVAILETCKYPEVLVKMNGAQEKTAAAFRNLIEDFPCNTQEVFYEMVRYPGLIADLAGKRDMPAAQRESLKQLPENQRETAFETTRDHPGTLQKMADLENTAQRAFEDMIAAYPAPAQAAFRQLVGLPEALQILNEDLRLSIMAGDLYREDPAAVIRQTDSLHLAVARSQAEELATWKSALENDPEAQREMESASREYAEAMGYDSEDYPGDDLYYENTPVAPTTAIRYDYPWWFGYPWWYPHPCWRPYPWWYDWGYYRYPGVVIVYMPSWYFMDWYFYHPHHHYRYSHLSAHFVRHYYGHRRSGTAISTSVGAWRERNRDLISDDWLRDQGRLPERMKEYGRFEQEREQHNVKNPRTPLSKDQFLEKNARKYPELNRSRTDAQTETRRDQPAPKPSDWAPRKEPSPKTEPARPPRIEPEKRPAQDKKPEKPQPKTAPETKKPENQPGDYHRQKWEESGKKVTPRQVKPQPAPKPQKTAPKTSGGGRKN